MKSLWFVTPVYGRYAITRACLAQRRWLCDRLRQERGIDADCVVVGNDRNLETARELGFHVIRQSNQPLGRKFNDGLEYACRRGADLVVPAGSDAWLHPDHFALLPGLGEIRSTRYLAIVDDTGTRLARLRLAGHIGCGDGWIIPRDLLEPCAWRPVGDTRARGINGSIWRRLRNRATWTFDDVDELQVVNLKSADAQINSYATLAVEPWLVREQRRPWPTLARRYPIEIVEAARGAYAR